MPPEWIAWLTFGLLALVGLHEWTPVLIDRWHAHPCVCLIVRDFQMLSKIRSVVVFTAHGRRRRQPIWAEEKTRAGRQPERVPAQAA